MAEQEYIIELCTSYSREELIKQRKKIEEGTAEDDPVVIDATTDELDRAIADYDKEEYKCIREEIFRYNVEILCMNYSLEDIIKQCKKIEEGTAEEGPAVIDVATADELNQAIADYDKEEYKCIREEMRRDWEKFRLI